VSDGFKFDMAAKRVRLTDEALVVALQDAAEKFSSSYFSTMQYDNLHGERPHSTTIIERFGSWKKALNLIGISDVRKRQYSIDELIQNLETVWKKLGYAPGKRQIATLGAKISESPYKRHWGSLQSACEALEAFHNKRISKEKLLAGNRTVVRRTTIPLKVRYLVLERDNNRCVRCGVSRTDGNHVRLEVDHIHPVRPADPNVEGGGDELENLQTLCWECNQGKKNRLPSPIKGVCDNSAG
jgi:hypothetical protein